MNIRTNRGPFQVLPSGGAANPSDCRRLSAHGCEAAMREFGGGAMIMLETKRAKAHAAPVVNPVLEPR